MAGDEEREEKTFENEMNEQSSFESQSNVEEKTTPKLKNATIKLKTEALRRLKQSSEKNLDGQEIVNEDHNIPDGGLLNVNSNRTEKRKSVCEIIPVTKKEEDSVEHLDSRENFSDTSDKNINPGYEQCFDPNLKEQTLLLRGEDSYSVSEDERKEIKNIKESSQLDKTIESDINKPNSHLESNEQSKTYSEKTEESSQKVEYLEDNKSNQKYKGKASNPICNPDQTENSQQPRRSSEGQKINEDLNCQITQVIKTNSSTCLIDSIDALKFEIATSISEEKPPGNVTENSELSSAEEEAIHRSNTVHTSVFIEKMESSEDLNNEEHTSKSRQMTSQEVSEENENEDEHGKPSEYTNKNNLMSGLVDNEEHFEDIGENKISNDQSKTQKDTFDQILENKGSDKQTTPSESAIDNKSENESDQVSDDSENKITNKTQKETLDVKQGTADETKGTSSEAQGKLGEVQEILNETNGIPGQTQGISDDEQEFKGEDEDRNKSFESDPCSKESLLTTKSSQIISTYTNEEYQSKPLCTGDIPLDLLILYHSFGFECTKRSNLHLLSPDHVLFSAGNTFQILNLKTKEQINIRSTSGQGIGALAVHPSRKYFAISEKGVKPNIIVYQYPSLQMYRILREGTERSYSNLDFSPSGDKLASVGSDPDYMLTVWDWKKEKIILRSKAFSQDVYKVAFSPEDEGHLCSSGTGHIKFWTMATTFTGLKLQGDLGRFGTTELSDISGFVELPDGKVLSGSEWGNMLLWDGGLIKVELTRKGKKTCHHGNIEQFFLDEGELITIGIDGYIKVWDFENIDTADSLDESKLFEIEPMSEMKVGNDVKLLSMEKSVDEEETSMWYAQDANGGIWSLDLSFSHTSQSPIKLFSYHAGKITALSLSPITHACVTTGEDGTVRLYDYFEKQPLCQKKFNNGGCSILWMPKVVDPNCASVLVGFADGVVRFLTIAKNTQRTANKHNFNNVALHLTQVFKPHLKAVTCLTIDIQGKILATGSEDGTVFFFSIEKIFKPIGFVEIGAEVVSLDWSSVSKGNKLLVVAKNGTVNEFLYPQLGKFDTTKSFQLPTEQLVVNQFVFQSVKDDLLRAEEEERRMKEAAEKQRKAQAKREERKAQGEEEPEEDAQEKDEEEEEQAPPIKHAQGNVLKGFYRGAGSDKFILTMDGFDAGYFYECRFLEPKRESQENMFVAEEERNMVNAIKIPAINDIPITSLCFSKNGDYMAMGLQNGALRVQNMKSSTLDKLSSYWCINAHDNENGRVSDISISFDNRFLMSVGDDGNIFVFSFIDEQKLKEFESSRKTLQTKGCGFVLALNNVQNLKTIDARPADDIDDPNHYSIELEKQKAEHDKLMRLAEEKKQQVRNTINRLRKDFRKLKIKNGELPSYLQLTAEEFIIDPQMKFDIQAETKEKVRLLELETSWESERQMIALMKLRKKYKDCVECERVVLHSFLTAHDVCSFRACALPTEFFDMLYENKRQMTIKETNVGPAGQARKMSQSKGRKASIVPPAEIKDIQDTSTQKQPQTEAKLDSKVAKMIEKAEQRRQKRMKRQKEWEELYQNKPDENYEDPEDVASIKLAEMTIGDFKMKSSDDYVVPDNERVNAEKKKGEFFELKEEVYRLKKEFNDRLLTLRDKKIHIIENIKLLRNDLEIVQSLLPSRCHVVLPDVPEMKPDEHPEKLLEYTTEELIDFRKNVLGLDVTKFENINEQTANEKSKNPSTRATNDARLRSTSIISSFSSVPPSASSVQGETPEFMEDQIRNEQFEHENEKTALQLSIEQEEEIRLTYRRDDLLAKIHNLLFNFDAELRLLRHDKVHLDTKLKNADLRKVTLFEELILLKDFEKREENLADKLFLKEQEKEEMEDKVEECRDDLGVKKEEYENLQGREKFLMQTLNYTIGENNKFHAFLTKVFKKKIKRAKKKTTSEGSSGEESDEDDSDEDFDDSDEKSDSDEDELDDSVCPAGCDQAIFDQICVLRERRLDLEELLFETKKTCDNLKKDLDTLTKKVKIIDAAVQNAFTDLEAFQREKQQKLNELDVVVTLKLDQIQYVINNTLPQDLSQCLIFKGQFLKKLQARIKELEREKVAEKQLYKERRQQHVQMHRDKKAMQTKNKELEDRVQQIQMLKFGRLVDLEKLETVSVNRVAEELKEKLREREASNLKELFEWDREIDEHQSKLTQVVRENTKRLDSYTVLLQENGDLERKLNCRQKNLGGEFQGTSKKDLEERERLVQLVRLQSQEIDALKDEITVLSHKGGHILPPPQSLFPGNHDVTR